MFPTAVINGPTPEFVGKGRAFLQRMNTAGRPVLERHCKLIDAVGEHLHRRNGKPGRQNTITREHYQLVQQAFRQRCAAELCPPHRPTRRVTNRLKVGTVIACSGAYRHDNWTDDGHYEQCVDLHLVSCDIGGNRSDYSVALIASVSLHALARRYQRGCGVTDRDIQDDLWTLVDTFTRVRQRSNRLLETLSPEQVAQQISEFAADAPSGGAWFGKVMRAPDNPLVLAVRTFYNNDDRAAALTPPPIARAAA